MDWPIPTDARLIAGEFLVKGARGGLQLCTVLSNSIALTQDTISRAQNMGATTKEVQCKSPRAAAFATWSGRPKGFLGTHRCFGDSGHLRGAMPNSRVWDTMLRNQNFILNTNYQIRPVTPVSLSDSTCNVNAH